METLYTSSFRPVELVVQGGMAFLVEAKRVRYTDPEPSRVVRLDLRP